MSKKRVYSAKKKVEILREHLDNNVPVSELCDRYNIHPNNFYNWKKRLFEGALDIFKIEKNSRKTQKKIENLTNKLQDRDSLISIIVSENITLKKNINGDV